MGALVNIAVKRLVDYLAKQGNKIVTEAMATKAVGNITFNQNDAFGYAVFYNGKEKKRGYANPTPRATETHRGYEPMDVADGTGREWLNDFLSTYDGIPSKGFALIIVNAAYYTVFHERKFHYQVISQTYGSLQEIAERYAGASVTII